jgi:hypothetical protein
LVGFCGYYNLIFCLTVEYRWYILISDMAHFVKLSVLDPGHDDLENTTNRKYNSQLINLDMVINVEQSKVHSLIFTKNNTQHPIRVRESLDEILSVSKGCVKNVLNG